MKNMILYFISVFASMIGYFHFFHLLFPVKRTRLHSFVFLLLLNVVFFLSASVYEKITDPVAGMLVKSSVNMVLIIASGYYLFRAKLSALALALFADMAILSLVELMMGSVVDFSVYINPGSGTFSYEADLVINLVRTGLLICLHTLLYRTVRQVQMRVPLRYYFPLIIFFFSHIMVFTTLSYYMFSKTPISPVIFVILILSCLLAGVLPAVLLNDHRSGLSFLLRLSRIESLRKQLEQQTVFAESQNQAVEELAEVVRNYKKEADFEQSIEPVFRKQEDYVNGLYCDDPLTNTQLMYYAEVFRKKGIPFTFSVRCSLNTADYPYLILTVVSGTLSTTADFARLDLSSVGNLYTVVFRTGIAAYKNLIPILETIASEFSSYGAEYKTDTSDTAVSVTLHYRIFSGAVSETVYESHH